MESGLRASQKPQSGVIEWASSLYLYSGGGPSTWTPPRRLEASRTTKRVGQGFHGIWHFYERLAVSGSPALKTGYQICISAKQP
jgi:hypothetical protein